MEKIGDIIRSNRRQQNITLKILAEKTGLSVSFLSEIERGVAGPSMASLRKISQALGISTLSFSEKEDSNNGITIVPIPREEKSVSYIQDVKIVRKDQRKKLIYPNYPGFYELLTPDLQRQLQVLYVKIEPGFETGPDPLLDPPGEKFTLVLSGSYHVTIDGESFTLEEGDSIYYPADRPVFFKNISKVAVELILIITPPGF